MFDTWGGMHGTGAALWKAISFAATAGLRGSQREQKIFALRRALAVQVAKAVAAQLETLQLSSPLSPSPPGSLPLPIGLDLLGNVLYGY